jgi:uncharacterized protein with PQ loop repeat
MQHEPISRRVEDKKLRKGEPLTQTFWTGVLDVAIYPVGALSLILTLPQVYDVWVLHEVAGVSVITWSMWTISSIVWVLYGIAHRAAAIVFMQICWITLYLLVISGTFIFR